MGCVRVCMDERDGAIECVVWIEWGALNGQKER